MLKRIFDALRLSLAAGKMAAGELYVIEGHHPELAGRVKEAMSWLISEDADRLGLKQLRRAFALNFKPLRIRLAQQGECAYYSSNTFFNTEHVVHIGADSLKQMRYRDVLGGEHMFDLRQLLAHEMEHAGQLSAYMNRLYEVELIQFRKAKIAEFVQRPDQLKVMARWVKRLREAAPEHAKRCAEQMYDEVFEPARQWFVSQAGANKKFKSYLENVEGPAIAAENLVLAKLGKPLRNPSYLDAGHSREEEMEALLSMLRPAPRPETPQFVNDIITQREAQPAINVLLQKTVHQEQRSL